MGKACLRSSAVARACSPSAWRRELRASCCPSLSLGQERFQYFADNGAIHEAYGSPAELEAHVLAARYRYQCQGMRVLIAVCRATVYIAQKLAI